MKTRISLTLALCLLLTAGCATLEKDPYGSLRMSQEAFTGTVNILTELHKDGQIGDDEVEIITQAIHAGEQYLIEWEEAIKAGKDHAAIVAAFQTALDTLTTYTE